MTTAAPRRPSSPGSKSRKQSGSETRQRDDKIDVRFTETEVDAIRKAAELAGLKPAAFLRTAGLQMAQQLLPVDAQTGALLAS